MAVATWIKAMLQRHGVAYEELRHGEVFTAQEVAQREHVSGHRLAKVVAVMADGRIVALVVPASRRVVLERVRDLLRVPEIRLASEAEMTTFFRNCETGAIPALRHWGGLEMLMDASMQVRGDIVLQAGTHRDAIRLKYDDWLRIVNPRVESFSEPESVGTGPVIVDRQVEEEERARPSDRESGQPGGGSGRIDEVGRSGVYPGSGPYPEGPAEVRTPGTWVHGQRDDTGREVEGGSELIYFQRQSLLGGATPAPSGPAAAHESDPGEQP